MTLQFRLLFFIKFDTCCFTEFVDCAGINLLVCSRNVEYNPWEQALQLASVFQGYIGMVFTMSQYNSLPLHQKAVVLGEEALFLMTLEKNEMVYALYSFCGYYIEVLLDQEDKRLIDIIAFQQLKRIDKYLESILLVGV